jgi:hypothetical protein
LTSRLQSFETEVLTQEENLAGLATLNRGLLAKVADITSPRRVVLDMDSTEAARPAGPSSCGTLRTFRRVAIVFYFVAP